MHKRENRFNILDVVVLASVVVDDDDIEYLHRSSKLYKTTVGIL